MEQPRETAGTTMRLVIDYVRRHGGDRAVDDLLREAGETRPLDVLEDEAQWSSYDAKIALFEAAATVTGQRDVARRIGEGALASEVGGSVKLLIGLVGSPAQVLRGIARAHSKFSTAAEMGALTVEPSSALVRYRLFEDHEPSSHDCLYTQGLLSQVPVLFGLPTAMVRHDVCQVRGAEACLYALRWHPRRGGLARVRRRTAHRATTATSPGAVLRRLEDLQETVAELVADRSVEEVLTLIAERARSTVGAQRFLLVTRLEDDLPPQVHEDGFGVAESERTAALLLDDLPTNTGEHVIVASLQSAGHDYGRIAAFGQSPFFEHEEGLLRSYASLAATALDAVTALDAARDRQHVAEVLLRFARALLETRDRAEVARVTADAALSVAFADASSVLLVDHTEGALRTAASAGWPADLQPAVDALVIRPEDTPEMDELLEHPERPRLYDPVTTTDPFILGALRMFRSARMVIIPLWSEARLWGIVVTSWGAESTPPSVDRLVPRLSGLADQAVTALDRAELAEQVHRQATVDPLTGLANRKEFTDRLEYVLARQQTDRPGSPDDRAAVLFLDLDCFKEVNDTLGHAAGDELLCTVGRRLQDMVRPEDLVARLGGDEFTVLLSPVHDRHDLEEFAARVRATLAEPVVIDGQVLKSTPSVGAVMVSSSYVSVRDVLRDADSAMYSAKKAGGNGHMVFEGDRAEV